MPDRLADLRRQRALIAEHLAWIDREIASASPADLAPSPSTQAAITGVGDPAAAMPVSPAAPASVPENPTLPPAQRTVMLGGKLVPLRPEPLASSVLPGIDPVDIRSQTKRGCFLYVLLATVVLAGGIWLLIWMAHNSRITEELAPYIGKVTFITLILILGAGIRSLIARLRSK